MDGESIGEGKETGARAFIGLISYPCRPSASVADARPDRDKSGRLWAIRNSVAGSVNGSACAGVARGHPVADAVGDRHALAPRLRDAVKEGQQLARADLHAVGRAGGRGAAGCPRGADLEMDGPEGALGLA